VADFGEYSNKPYVFQHIVKKRKHVNITIKQLNWLLGRKSNLAIENKLLIYKTIIIPIWTHGTVPVNLASQ
jgi:hypothetical protein